MDIQLYDYPKRIFSIEKNILEASYPDKNKELIFDFENMPICRGHIKCKCF